MPNSSKSKQPISAVDGDTNFETLYFKGKSVLRNIVDKRAQALRAEIAAEHSSVFIKSFDPKRATEMLVQSPFRDYIRTFPSENPLLTLAFNLDVTARAIDQILNTKLAPEPQLFLCSRVAELGMYSVLDPLRPNSPLQFLNASKQFGYFFTPPEVAMLIAKLAIGKRSRLEKAIDPAAGCGALLGALVLLASRESIQIDEISSIEMDPFTGKLLKKVLRHLLRVLNLKSELNCIVGDAIQLYATRSLPMAGYDCILMNPPYGRVKFLRNSLTNAETQTSVSIVTLKEQEDYWHERTKQQVATLRGVAADLGINGGPLDYQRIFAGIAQKLLTPSGRCAYISPSNWLGDHDGRLLRKQVIDTRSLESVVLFPEDTGLFATVNQPTAITCIAPDPTRQNIKLTLIKGRELAIDDEYLIDITKLKTSDPNMLRIPRISHDQHDILEQLQSFPRIADIEWIRNCRGELDQTLGKEFIQGKRSKLRLVRGDHIERYIIRPPEASGLPSYISANSFIAEYKSTPKYDDVTHPRIAGRQCSYLNKDRRLSFVVIPADVVLGNSCNYISINGMSSKPLDSLFALSAILNSAIVEWYFRTFSSNNHVANYEIDDLPVCLGNIPLLHSLAACGRFLHEEYAETQTGGKLPSSIEDYADALVAYGYCLSPQQTLRIFSSLKDERGQRVANMVGYLKEEGVPEELSIGKGWHQHTPPSLSELDKAIVRSIPQGGNWMDVPKDIPSKRLEQIRKMSEWRGIVRTSYYGRLRPDQPAYTIATYYNRPGNGTNIHPWEDRTLTNREAARLQSFPDWYLFLGSDSSIRKQIGNAVPPLLGYAVAKYLGPYKGKGPCVDLFAGAGGLSLGLELAGWNIAAAVEYDEQIAATYCFNRACEKRPNMNSGATLFINSDLTDAQAKEAAIKKINEKVGEVEVGAIVGGPPCQGFSHAGWRLKDDARNNLAVVFLDFVQALKPPLVILENVEGILTYDKGRVISDLQKALMDLGFTVAARPWMLSAEQYGVPQMRRRVFLVATKEGVPPNPPPPAFEHCRGRRESEKAPGLFSPLPYPFTVGEVLEGLRPLMKNHFPRKRGLYSDRKYELWLKGLVSLDAMMEAARTASRV